MARKRFCHTKCELLMQLSRWFFALCSLCIFTSPCAAASFPEGFEETEVLASLTSPTAMAIAPDGRVFVLEQGGKIIVVKNGAALPAPALQLDVDNTGERGLLGMTFHPQFATNNFIYLFYTVPAAPARNRVSRFSVAGDTIVRASEVVLLEIPLGSITIHNSGTLRFGIDGMLYISVGENGVPTDAQSLDNLRGKILRLLPDGTVPADNPFPQATGINRAIWAMGFRNPFSFSIQPGTGKIYINDVGQNAAEEVNEGVPGGNYGWPINEGFAVGSPYRNPLYTYWHIFGEGGQCAITGGTFYNPPSISGVAAEYLGSYFLTDYCAGWMKRIPPGEAEPVDFGSGLSFPVALAVDGEGAFYILQRGSFLSFQSSGSLRRVKYTGQQKPVITTPPKSQLISVGRPVTFNVSVSGPGPITYQWQRNGTNITGATTSSYTLAAPTLADNGVQFRVVAANSYGTQASPAATLSVTASQPPTATITSPAAGASYAAGDVITYTATGTDPETGALPSAAFTWRVDLHHDTHVHPFLPNATGNTAAITIPRTGHWESTVFYRLHVTVTDSAGLTFSTFRDITPRLVEISVQTNPPGLLASVDSWERYAPFNQTGVVGMQRELSTRPIQTINGLTYQFTGWSDGGAVQHPAITPASNITYTATFQPVGGCAVTVTPLIVQAGREGGTGRLTITSPENCSWTAIEKTAWAELYPITGSGTTSVRWTAYPNYSTRQRTTVVQIGSATLTINQDPGTGTANERFVGQIYTSFFGRRASPVEIAYHVNNSLARGVSRAELAARFMNSEEFANSGLFVAGLYMGLLRRDSEYAGWLFQRNALASGSVSPDAMVANFINSAEFQLAYGNLSNLGFVDVLYRNILRRAPSAAEMQFHAGALAGGVTRVQMAKQFLNSPEFRTNGGPRMLAFLIYATLLQRDGSPAELTFREQQIRAIGSTTPVIEDILNSPEFAALLQ